MFPASGLNVSTSCAAACVDSVSAITAMAACLAARIKAIPPSGLGRSERRKGDQLHCPYYLATLSHLAFEGARALSVLTKSRNWDTQYMAIAPLLKSGRRTSRMP